MLQEIHLRVIGYFNPSPLEIQVLINDSIGFLIPIFDNLTPSTERINSSDTTFPKGFNKIRAENESAVISELARNSSTYDPR